MAMVSTERSDAGVGCPCLQLPFPLASRVLGQCFPMHARGGSVAAESETIWVIGQLGQQDWGYAKWIPRKSTFLHAFCDIAHGSGPRWRLIELGLREHLSWDGDDGNSSVGSHAACWSCRLTSSEGIDERVLLDQSQPLGAQFSPS
ncbi:unnamed protein product [Pleuronectes platessa]|uniref:Uncharacterized protein n=1 Tax=Pleuronectes platessa TaxID=8262 RepID=A0A9N7YL99_PLEPL|nr:unnamed protein product [Pleuronectes platessa]